MSYLNIQTLMAEQLQTVQNLPTIAWGNVKYKPTNGTAFVRPRLVPLNSEVVTFDRRQMNTGLYSIALFYPFDEGEGELLTMCDKIIYTFKQINRLEKDETCIHISDIALRGPFQLEEQDGQWLQANVEIKFYNYQDY